MSKTLSEFIKELQELEAEGWGSAEVMVRCEGFELVDMDSDCELKSFDTVPCTGVEECVAVNADSAVIIGREDPDEVKARMVKSGWWGEVDEDATAEAETTQSPTPKEAEQHG